MKCIFPEEEKKKRLMVHWFFNAIVIIGLSYLFYSFMK
jgi:hypothetical protein